MHLLPAANFKRSFMTWQHPDILKKILQRKQQGDCLSVANVLPIKPVTGSWLENAEGQSVVLLKRWTQSAEVKSAVIAEVKKKPPQLKFLRLTLKQPEIALSYENGGAACLSVLTWIRIFSRVTKIIWNRHVTACQLPRLSAKILLLTPIRYSKPEAIGADCILWCPRHWIDEFAWTIESAGHSAGMDVRWSA